jgi:hypothetical protein
MKFTLAGFTVETSEQAATIWFIAMQDSSKEYLLRQCENTYNTLKASGNQVDLDEVAKNIHKELKDSEEVSFVAPVTSSNTTAQLKMDIVKHIITVKLAEQQSAQKARETKEKKQMIMQIIAQKQNDALTNSSVEDLQKMLDNL